MPLYINSLNAELNPICHLLALLGAHPILHISRMKGNTPFKSSEHLLYWTVQYEKLTQFYTDGKNLTAFWKIF
jgi:hypothetical protein